MSATYRSAMTPFEQAGEFCDRWTPSFERWLVAYATCGHGYVLSAPSFFAMGRAVRSDAEGFELMDVHKTWPREEQDAWFLFLAAGDIDAAMALLPYELPNVIFYRSDGELRKIPFERVQRFLAK